MNDQRTSVDLLINNIRVITMDHERRELSNAYIAIDEGKILGIGPVHEASEQYEPRRKIEGSGQLAVPGLINAHNHLFQVMCRGLGDGSDLSDWAQRAIWRVAPFLGETACQVAAALACVEMIESGTTSVVDSHYLHSDPRSQDGIARACLDSGMRAILARAAVDSNDVPKPFRETPRRAVEATERFIRDWDGKANRLMVRPEPMNEVLASKEMILALRALSREAGVGFHMHAAEERTRPLVLQKEVGFRTVEYLGEMGVLGPDVVLAHCVWLSEKEIELIAETQTSVIHNPVSNQFLADGVAPVPELLERGVRMGLGTDGAASNNSLDMFEVMKSTALLHKIHNLRSDLMSSSQVFEMATVGGARALGIGEMTGSIEVGKRADILLLSLKSPRMIPCYSTLSNLVFSASSSIVDTVVIEGCVVAENGACISLDRDEVLHEAVELAQYIREQL